MRTAGIVLLAAVLHFAFARLSMHAAAATGASPIWIPAGVDAALLVLVGRRAGIGVFAGDLASGAAAGGVPLGIAAGEAAGNALGAVFAAWVIVRFATAPGLLRRRRDVLVLTLVAAPGAGLISATLGALSLAVGGRLASDTLAEVWGTWMLSDLAGVVVLTPAVLILATRRRRRPSLRRAAEAAAVLAALAIAFIPGAALGTDETYLVFPVVVWAAVRFRLPGAAVTSVLAAVAAVALTLRGHGSFGDRDGVEALLHTQGFMAVSTLTGLLLAVVSDERAAATRRERAARQRLQAFTDHSPAVIFVRDLAGRYTGVNRRFTALHAHDEADVVGRTDAEIFGSEIGAPRRASDIAVATGGVPRTRLEAIDRPEGRRHYETIKFPLLDESGAIAGVAGIALDVTDRVVAESQREEALRRLAHRALHDPLTGLPNRVLLAERLEEALVRAAADGTVLAVLLIDLDQFKNVNDSFGHHTGDDLLTQVAPRLRAAVGPQDTVARFGGDEFVVLCEGLAGPWDALEAARGLSAAWAEPFRLGEDDVFISGSAGVAVAHAGRGDPATLLREADAAMYRAKARGRGQVELYDEAMRARAYDRLRLEGDLRRALADGDIQIAYQPIVDLRDGRPLAVEALARWTHPQRGEVSPASFIPMAEESGLIADLGRHVLRTACAQIARWRAELPGAEELQLSVNVSARQIARGELLGDVRDALREFGLPPHALALEVTESALMEETDAPGPVLASLRGVGVRIVLDDFGTGYSSLSYLRRFPLDGIKLDRSFVDGLGQPDAAAVVEAIVGMGATLGLVMTAEGIETREQAERLRDLGCPRGQGYLLARPLPAAEAAEVLADRLRRRPSLAPAPGRRTGRSDMTHKFG